VRPKGGRFPRQEPRGRDSDGASYETRLALLAPRPRLFSPFDAPGSASGFQGFSV
jgi:hypothetical protein